MLKFNINLFSRCTSNSYYWKRKNVYFVDGKWCFRNIVKCTFLIRYHASSGAGTPDPSGALVFTPGFYWGSCCPKFSFLCNVLYIIVYPFVIFLLAIVLYVLQLTSSDLPLWYLQHINMHITTKLFTNVISTVMFSAWPL